MTDYKTTFELSIKDIDLIEASIRFLVSELSRLNDDEAEN